MGGCLFACVKKTKLENIQPSEQTFFSYEAKDNEGSIRKMSEFNNRKCILVVNVACKCGLTSDHYK